MKRFTFGLIGCGGSISLAFFALIFSAAVGGSSLAAAPEFHFELVEKYVCPGGSTLAYRLGRLESTEELPSSSNPIGLSSTGRPLSLSCLDDGQTVASGDGLLVRTIGSVLGLYFLACFLPLFLASGFVLGIIRSRLRTGDSTATSERSDAPRSMSNGQ